MLTAYFISDDRMARGSRKPDVENNTIPVKLNYVSTVNVDGMHSTDFQISNKT